ncbi:RND transporter [Pelagibaculum spongiae]|uniref:RND transporter n=2 Tax=Pelagibaculum spongiae TaxID=2080658 RepID=A0A2V1GXJ1_9GAMM|nr:RND transporter [Pelagibaculum spongiae]
MAERLLALSLNAPRAVFMTTLVAVIISIVAAFNIQIDTDPENMLPYQQQDRVFHRQVKQDFELYDSLVVGLVSETTIYQPETLARLKTLTDQIKQIEGVVPQQVLSFSTVDNIRQESGAIRFEWLMPQAPKSEQQASKIAISVAKLPMLKDTLGSGNGQAAAIYVPILDKHLSYDISQKIRALSEKPIAGIDLHITGLPVAEDTFGIEMFIQMAVSAPAAAVLIFILLWFFFRSLSLITAPMLLAMVTVIVTMGALIGSGFSVHIMSSMIPIFLMPIAVVDSVHLLSEFADRYHPGSSRRQVLAEIFAELYRPMLFTSITSALGFASLAFTPIPPVQVFGLYIAGGILLAFLLTLTFLPAWIMMLSEKQLAVMQRAHHGANSDNNRGENSGKSASGKLARLLPSIGRFALNYRLPITLTSVALLAISGWGISTIQINDNPVRWFKSDHEIRIADKQLNQHFAGTYDAWFVMEQTQPPKISGALKKVIVDLSVAELTENSLQQAIDQNQIDQLIDLANNQLDSDEDRYEQWIEVIDGLEQIQSDSRYFRNPQILAYMDRLAEYLESQPEIGKVNSLPMLIKTVFRELNSGQQQDFRLPDSQAGVAQALLSYQSSHRPDDLWHLVTPDYRKSLLWLQLKSGDNQDMSIVLDKVQQWIDDNPLPEGVTTNWAGLTYINVIWQQEMVAGMANSLLSAFIAVLVVMTLLFRSFKYGLLAMAPLTLTISLIYGIIGFIGKDYDMPIAVLSALTLGLSVDFAIHFLQRARSLYQEYNDWQKAIAEMFQEPARAIARNALVIAIGFTPLLLAPLVPYITVGFFLAAIMAISALVTLLLLPALLFSFRKTLA